MVYNPDFLAYSVSSHEKSLSNKPELYNIWKYFKKFLFLNNTSLCTKNDLKHNFSKTKPLNGVEPWFFGL